MEDNLDYELGQMDKQAYSAKNIPIFSSHMLRIGPQLFLKVHHGGEKHRTYKEIVAKIGEEGWIVGTQLNGIQKPFIKKVGCCKKDRPKSVASFIVPIFWLW